MNSVTMRRTALRAARDLILMLSFLWFCSPATPAGELSPPPDGPRLSLSLPDLAGQQRSLEEFSGRVVLVNFWASWCSPCIKEMPSIHRLIEAMRDKPFAVIGVNVAEPALRARTAAGRLHLGFPVLLDTDSTVFKGWGATILPTTYILDGEGRVRYIGRGPMEWDRPDLIDMLVKLAEQPPHGK